MFQEFAEDFLGELTHEGVFVVVLTTPGLQRYASATDEELYDYDDFVSATRAAAGFCHIPVIDVAQSMKRVMRNHPDEYTELFSDNSHLSEKGKEFIADLVYDAFAKATDTP